MNQTATASASGTSGSLSATLSGLTPGTKYYFQAFVTVDGTGVYATQSQTFYGTEYSFTTTDYLTDYGMPDVSGLGLSLRASGPSGGRTDRDDYWYSYSTNNNNRQIAVHTFSPTSGEERATYVVLYDGSKYAPLWTAHTMNTTYWPDNNVGRADNSYWASDPAINLSQQSGLDDSSQYSRGHLVASDYRQTSKQQNRQTFYYSNQAPQWQTGFNDNVWAHLEQRVADIAPSGSTMLYVVTGVLYEGATVTKKSGNLNVPIPSHFYKCIMKCTFSGSTITGAQGIAFVYTNESHAGESYYKTGTGGFVTSIDAIEQRTGFDFFAKVPDNLEDGAESNTDPTWFIGASPNSVSRPTTFWGF